MSADPIAPEPSSVYNDDPAITDDNMLFRTVQEDKVTWNAAGKPLSCNSNLFQDNTNQESLQKLNVPMPGVSVYVQRVLHGDKSPAQVLLLDPNSVGAGIAQRSAKSARPSGQGICFWQNDIHGSHAIIFALSEPKKTTANSKKLAQLSEIVIDPTRVGS